MTPLNQEQNQPHHNPERKLPTEDIPSEKDEPHPLALGDPAERLSRLDTIRRSNVLPTCRNVAFSANFSFFSHLIISGYEVGIVPRTAIGTAVGAGIFYLYDRGDKMRTTDSSRTN